MTLTPVWVARALTTSMATTVSAQKAGVERTARRTLVSVQDMPLFTILLIFKYIHIIYLTPITNKIVKYLSWKIFNHGEN